MMTGAHQTRGGSSVLADEIDDLVVEVRRSSTHHVAVFAPASTTAGLVSEGPTEGELGSQRRLDGLVVPFVPQNFIEATDHDSRFVGGHVECSRVTVLVGQPLWVAELSAFREGENVAMRQDPIRMHPYDPRWPRSFQREASGLAVVLRPWLVEPLEHIGSTAVPGLVAKAIIDIVAVVADIDAAQAAAEPLASVGWIAAPEPTDVALRKLSFCTPSVERRTHHLHVVEHSSTGWRGWIAFRDHLRANPALATEYGELKRRLAAAHGSDPNQRDAYRAGKAAWIAATTHAATNTHSDSVD